MAVTLPPLAEVAPATFIMSPALVRALLASVGVLPVTSGTVLGVSDFSAPK